MRWASAVLVAAILGAGAVRAGTAPTTPFTLSDDPAEAVLRVSFAAATTPYAVEWNVYGDGRLEKVEKYTGDPTKRREVLLSKDQIRDLVSFAVAHGLADADERTLDAKVADGWATARPSGQRFTPAIPPPPEDAAIGELALRLRSYGVEGRPRTVVLRFKGVEELAPYLPGVTELQGWAQLAKKLDALVSQEVKK